MGSNHDSNKLSEMCNLQILKRLRLPKRTRNTHIGTAPVQSDADVRQARQATISTVSDASPASREAGLDGVIQVDAGPGESRLG